MDYKNLKIKFFSILSKQYAVTHERKIEIRKEIREEKRWLEEEQKAAAGIAVFTKIEAMPEFQSATTILIYWAMPDELPTQQAIRKWCTDKQILLPSIEGNKLLLKYFLPNGKLVQKRLGIWEPELNEVFTGKVDIAIVPGIGFDRKKNRLGRGKGYYDRFLKKQKPLKIGVGFDFQLLDSVPVSKHDVEMDRIVTPSETIL